MVHSSSECVMLLGLELLLQRLSKTNDTAQKRFAELKSQTKNRMTKEGMVDDVGIWTKGMARPCPTQSDFDGTRTKQC